MTETLRAELRLASRDIPWLAAIIGGTYLFGVALMLGICLIFHISEYGPMGTFFALLGILVAILARRNLNPHNRLRLAVCMGTPRMRFVAADALVTALETTVSIGVVWALGMLEFLFYRTMFGWDGDVLNAINLFQWQNALLFVLAMTVFNLFLMAFLNRFGIKVFFFIWIPLCLLNPLLTPAVYAAREGDRSLMAGLGRMVIWVVDMCSGIPWPVLAGGVLLLLTGISLLLLRRCEVKL